MLRGMIAGSFRAEAVFSGPCAARLFEGWCTARSVAGGAARRLARLAAARTLLGRSLLCWLFTAALEARLSVAGF
ncbi:hypothetical protein NDU88_011013 [Pleurodeles waltl]|uniref:Uncharacterized protein n=1 Tax=Pleurodeles waltl TaxID=8319 RepID=A0AAV7R048_PLEWA|nr:hypothetical protein NDU88_011013 [Pleurodeles waltl]